MKPVRKWLIPRNKDLVEEHRNEKKMKTKQRILLERNELEARKMIIDIQLKSQEESLDLDPLLLPKELWELLFEKYIVTTTRDLLNCYNVCQLFQHILQDAVSKQIFEHILPFVIPMLDTIDVLRCRLVCQSWCTSIDSFLERPQMDSYLKVKTEQQDSRGALYLDRLGVEGGTVGPYQFHLPFASSLNTLKQEGHRCHNCVRDHLKCQHKNPLIGRKVHLLLEEPLNTSYSDANELIDNLGSFIHHLSITCITERDNIGHFYVFCMRCVTRCKNLRSITMTAQLSDDDEDYDWNNINAVIAQHEIEYAFMAPVTDYSKDNQIPLDGLHFVGDQDDRQILKGMVLDAFCSRLKHLTIPAWNYMYPYMEWKQLTRLSIDTDLDEGELSTLGEMDIPNLKRLSLWCHRLDNSWLQKLVEVVRSIGTLCFLVLAVNKPKKGEVFKYERNSSLFRTTHMPSTLTTLVIQGKYTLSNFDFLLLFPFILELGLLSESLEEVPIWTDRRCLSGCSRIFCNLYTLCTNECHCMKHEPYLDIAKILENVRVNGTAGNQFLESNLWESLPMLEKLDVALPGHRRGISKLDYEDHQSATACNRNRTKELAFNVALPS